MFRSHLWSRLLSSLNRFHAFVENKAIFVEVEREEERGEGTEKANTMEVSKMKTPNVGNIETPTEPWFPAGSVWWVRDLSG